MGEQPADDQEERKRFARIQLLHNELDHLLTDASNRQSGIYTKASFLAVSAGVLIAASTAQLWQFLPGFGVGALAFGCVALVCAAVALRPGKRIGIQGWRIVARHFDSTQTAFTVEREIVQDKGRVLEEWELDLRQRGNAVWLGFGGLSLSAVSLTVVFAAQVLEA